MKRFVTRGALALLAGIVLAASTTAHAGLINFPVIGGKRFHLEEASIDDIEQALATHQLTCVQLVTLYLKRIKAYNGECTKELDPTKGILGAIDVIPNAGQLDAYETINLRPATLGLWGFDEHHARSLTDLADDDPNMPDALETAAALDQQYARTGKKGPLFCIPFGIKDEYDTFDMRTTDAADAFYANDRPPDDAAAVAKLRKAGAVLLGKTTMGEYASASRSSFGGQPCNAYDTTRSPSGSSAGSGIATSANLAVCSMAEETAGSVIGPSDADGGTGLAPTEELNSRQGLIPATLMNDRVGVICRSARDVSEVEDVLAGYDPNDPLTAFNVGELPENPYAFYTSPSSFKGSKPLAGIRIGILRENMVIAGPPQAESVQLVQNAIVVLQKLGATIVDPGVGGSIFTPDIAQQFPYLEPQVLIAKFPALFSATPIDDLVNMFYDPSLFPTGAGTPVITNLGAETTTGERKYVQNRWLAGRGDANIHNIQDLINKSNFWSDPNPNIGTPAVGGLVSAQTATTLTNENHVQRIFTLSQIIRDTFAKQGIDLILSPTTLNPPKVLTYPSTPGAGGSTTVLGAHGFPELSVPVGLTSVVYDVVPATLGATTGVLTATPARLPVGMELQGLPFSEPLLLHVAAAYQAAAPGSRVPPPAFGPLPGEP